MDHKRPDPDELLKSVASHDSSRGKLKLFLGASAGVGKTYAMLSEAHELRGRGVDIVVGYVETHGRQETAELLEGLPVVPMLVIEYRNTELREVDVAAIVARRPEIVVIDELAHTNAPGSRHRKRWQDVAEVLDAGIDVYTALNIQHLESLNDVVAQITGVRVQETVPDSFVGQAHQIEVIDIPPAELQQRLKDGKVYVPEKIDQALEGFFKTANLTALRELALRRTADAVDAEMRRLKTQEGSQQLWATRERVIVCVAPSRLASRVVRSAARLGAASHAELIAVYVESDRQLTRSESEQSAARDALELARNLDMEVVTLTGHDIAEEIAAFAQRRNATLVVVGKPIRARWKELLYGSVVDEIVRKSGDIDVHVITGEEAVPSPSTLLQRRSPDSVTVAGSILVLSTVAFATVLGALTLDLLGQANVAMFYVLGVAFCSSKATRTEAIASATLGVLCFNFFFVEPRFTFAVSDTRYVVLFAGMLGVALVVSSLTHRLKQQLVASSSRERRTASLYRLTQQLSQYRSKRDLAEAAAREIREVFSGDVAVFLSDGEQLATIVPSTTRFEVEGSESAVAQWVLDHSTEAGRGTDTLPGSTAHYLPLKGAERTVGVLGFCAREDVREPGTRQLLETFANALGLSLERAQLAKESNDARVQAETERIRSTLLGSISHDLRTPLTSIAGAASVILEQGGDQRLMAQTIFDESLRLNRQIQNLLDMNRLQVAGVKLNLDWHDPQDLVTTALERTRTVMGGRPVRLKCGADVPLIHADGLLIEKALINILENAASHTAPETAIEIDVATKGKMLEIKIRDHGPGLTEEELRSIFTEGFKSKGGGYGLGLAVVKSVLDLHGGTVRAANSEGGGAVFALTIPLPSKQPEVPHA